MEVYCYMICIQLSNSPSFLSCNNVFCFLIILLIRYHAHDDHLGLNLAYASNASSPYLTPRGIKMKGGLGLFGTILNDTVLLLIYAY